MSTLKILSICDVLFPQTTGGAGRVARELGKALSRQGVEIEFLTRQPAKPVKATDYIPTTYYSPPGPQLPLVLRRLFRQRVGIFKPDIIHVHQPFPAYFAIPRSFDRPVVYNFHSAWPEELKLKASPWPSWMRAPAVPLFRHIEKTVVEQASQIVVLSETSRHEIKSFYGRDAQLIPGGVNSREFHLFDKPKPNGVVNLISVRNLVPRMGLSELIRAMLLVPEHVRLDIGGDGPLRGELQELIHNLKLENRVALPGRIPDSELPQFYSSADWFVLPTVALEGFGLVILESLACGTPVLGTRVGAIPELLNRFDPEWIIPEPSAQAIAVCIRQALQKKGPDRADLHEKVARDFDWDVIASRYRELFQTLR
jgi:glycosyltransferase involved in cell wall biosynthesis